MQILIIQQTRKFATAVTLMFFLVSAALFSGCGNGTQTSTGVADPIPEATVTATGATTSTTTPLYTFTVCGDNRMEGITSGVFQRIIDSARSRGAAFMVDTGDISGDGSSEELTVYKQLTDGSGLKFYTLPGNHDVGLGGTSEAYASVIGATYYSFDFSGDHFILVDNADDRTGIDDAQMQWFDSDLSANAAKPHQFIFAHIPIADPSLPSAHVSGELGGEGLRSGQRLVRDASKLANVSDFFFGHIHAYWAYSLGGKPAYITGGAGAPLYFPEALGGYNHYLLVHVRPDGVDVEVVRV